MGLREDMVQERGRVVDWDRADQLMHQTGMPVISRAIDCQHSAHLGATQSTHCGKASSARGCRLSRHQMRAE